MRRTLFLLIALTVLVSPILGQANKVVGVWRSVEDVYTGPDAETISSPQPNQFIFTKKHYSMVRVPSKDARPNLDASKATADELRKVFVDDFIANSGTYDVKGNLLTIRPHVAKSPAFMQPGNYQTYTVKFDGEFLTLTLHSTNDGPAQNPFTVKLKRVE